MKVLIVDDHDLIRKGIRLLLEGFREVEVVGEASNGCDAITLALKHRPDVILLDLSMPTGLDGFTTAKTIMDELEDVKIIVLTMHDEEIYVQKAIQYNIHGYLLKNSQTNDLHEALQAVYHGKRFYRTHIPEERLEKMFAEKEPKSPLTNREREIVRLTFLGYTNSQIANKLKISPKTVENHKTNIMQKLGIKEKHELIQYALKNHIADLV
ncbi:DNA-binding response regulator [Anoxybacillus ayderensis]|uniref:response regulator n=1 Tax=Anoxybacillus TaxID=150247 RepID=UPI00109F72B2|nr:MULTISPECIES: response regulator transcription factor [Anoxybacillus]MBW9219161.1 response regulator transcription factor [Anoxybacillus sp. ST70]MCQ5364927.1 response regulator transcription factor [Anoxybacillus gonensis]THD17046.1 DNA-binding response regulator [Anoxybacillus ayderensis]